MIFASMPIHREQCGWIYIRAGIFARNRRVSGRRFSPLLLRFQMYASSDPQIRNYELGESVTLDGNERFAIIYVPDSRNELMQTSL